MAPKKVSFAIFPSFGLNTMVTVTHSNINQLFVSFCILHLCVSMYKIKRKLVNICGQTLILIFDSYIEMILNSFRLLFVDFKPATSGVESIREIQSTETEKPQKGNECLLKLISPPVLIHTITVTCVDFCKHISRVASDRFWVSDDYNNLVLTNTTGDILHHLDDTMICDGLHTVNNESELITVDDSRNINKLSTDMKKPITFIARTDFTWTPQCVYWSPLSGDLLVGFYREIPDTGKVGRYDCTG